MSFGVLRISRCVLIVKVVLGVALMGCGMTNINNRTKAKTTPNEVSVKVKLSSKDEVAGLGLVGGATYSAEISGCKSGLVFPAIDQLASNLRVLNGDRDCIFEIQSFALDGENYNLSGKNFSVGSVFRVSGDQNSTLEFTVISNLDNPISGDQLIRIVYGIVQKGDGEQVDAAVNAGIQIEGALPIALEIKKITLAIDGNDGAGLMKVLLECDEQMVAGKCMDIDPASLKGNAAKDTFGGELDLQQCVAIAHSGQNLIAVPVGNSAAPLGGGESQQVKGPAPLFGPGNNQMVFAISQNANSCKYYQLKILKP